MTVKMPVLISLVLFFISLASISAATCPYDFTTSAALIPSNCHASATAPSATSCCWSVFGAYLFAAIRYSNLTGTAFLSAPATSSCASSFSSFLLTRRLIHLDLLDSTTCNLIGDPVLLAAGHRPCQFPTVSSIRSSVNFSAPIHYCTPPSVNFSDTSSCILCQTAVVAASYSLFNATRSRDFIPCSMANTLAVWSPNPPSVPQFISYSLCILQVIQNVGGFSTDDQLIPTPPSSQLISPSSSSSSSRSIEIAAGSSAAALASVAAIVVLTIAIIKKRRRTAEMEVEGRDLRSMSTIVLPTEGLYVFTKSELKKATDDYSDRLLIGEGGSGKVYLGKLPSGQHVAIKRIYKKKKLGEFYREVEILAKLRHHNLGTLVGYSTGNNKDHALVYEYVAGGNLARALYHGELTWHMRVRIAADVAEGISYLHELPGGAVVHRDVKPTNVLLTESGQAKLSDFGVSRVMPSEGSHVSTEIRGTMGYVDPDSFSAGHVSELADVYSFGVVLLELVTGMKAVVPTPSGGAESIVHVTRGMVVDEEADGTLIVDPKLGPEWDRATVKEVFDLACNCVRPFKNERPRIVDVLAVLRWVLLDLEERTCSPDIDDLAVSRPSNEEGIYAAR